MALLSPKALLRQAALLAQAVKNLRIDDGGDANIQLDTPYMNPPVRTAQGPSTPDLPGYFCVADHLNMFLVLDGILTWEQCFNIALGYIGSPLDSTFDPVNAFFNSAATTVYDQLVNAGIQWPPQTWVGGYSFGGAVAQVMSAHSRAAPPSWVNTTIHTFGSPRPGGETMGHQIDGSARIYRWMNDQDPIPIIPPRARNFPGIVIAFGVLGALRAQSFVQPKGGLQITAAGAVSDADVPTIPDAGFTGSLAQWLFDMAAGAAPDHAINTYINRLTLAGNLASDKGFIEGGDIEKVDRGGIRLVRDGARRYQTIVYALERQQNAPAVVVPEPELFIAVKQEGTWVVQFADQVVALCGTRRAARRLAFDANTFLRNLQARAAVDPSAIVEGLQQYFALAQEPGSGFSPLLNTNFPP